MGRSKSEVVSIGDEAGFTPEIRLWRAVILQALIDVSTKSYSVRYRKYKRRAVAWLLSKTEGFPEVCYSVGLDPDYVQQKAKSILEQGAVPISKLVKGRKSIGRFSQRSRSLVN